MSRQKRKLTPAERMCHLVDEVNRRLHAYAETAECFCGKRDTGDPQVADSILEFIEDAVGARIDEILNRRKHGHGRSHERD